MSPPTDLRPGQTRPLGFSGVRNYGCQGHCTFEVSLNVTFVKSVLSGEVISILRAKPGVLCASAVNRGEAIPPSGRARGDCAERTSKCTTQCCCPIVGKSEVLFFSSATESR